MRSAKTRHRRTPRQRVPPAGVRSLFHRRDLAALARVALDDPLFAQIVRTDHWTVGFWYDNPSSSGRIRSSTTPTA